MEAQERCMMQYRNDRYGRPLSALGYGCMRFTKGVRGIDLDKAEKELLLAIEEGVNYFDTAYIYPGSEETLGTILERNGLRDKVSIATKLPQYLIGSRAAIDRYFAEQLRRLKTDHVEYYLMHMLTDVPEWDKLVALGIEDWIREKKESGEIRNIGFSFHGSTEIFLELLDAYDWDFCQVQYNYSDENIQAGRRGVEYAHSKGIPVVIMEPLRGGRLVDLLPEEAKKAIAKRGGGKSPAELGLRWLWDQEAVTVILSGMNSEEMVRENCRAASEALPGCLTEEERTLIEDVKAIIAKKVKVGCTGCGYCMPCPKGVDIPGIFSGYNTMYTEGKRFGRHQFMQSVALRKEPGFATQCIGCGKCEKHCPQHLPIRQKLKEADRALRPLPYKIASAVAGKFLYRNVGGAKKKEKADRS